MKRRTVLLSAIAGALALSSLALPERRPLVWNVTHSVPTGLYWIGNHAGLVVGDRVAIKPPPRIRSLLAERGYLPIGVPLLKRVAAVSGQRVCRLGHDITIDGKFVAFALTSDRIGRRLPVWSGCRMLGPGEIFTLNPDQPASFDGRYFGPLPATAVSGRAVPLWTNERGDGPMSGGLQHRQTLLPPPTQETE